MRHGLGVIHDADIGGKGLDIEKIPFVERYLQYCAPSKETLASWELPKRLVKKVDHPKLMISNGLVALATASQPDPTSPYDSDWPLDSSLEPFTDSDICAFVRGDRPIPLRCPIYYFETHIKKLW